MIAFASSLDQAGIFAKSALDSAIALEIISGFDEKASTSINSKVPNLKEETTSKMEHSIGVPMQIIEKIEDVNVKNNFLESIKILKKNGFKTKQIELPFLEYSLPSYYVIAPAECSANLSRYDGIKFGHRCDEPKSLEDLYLRTRKEGFGKEVNGAKRWLDLGFITIQVSEVSRLFIMLWVCSFICRSDINRVFNKCLIMIIILSTIILFQRDFVSTALLVSTFFALMLVAGLNLKKLLSYLSLALIVAIPLIIYQHKHASLRPIVMKFRNYGSGKNWFFDRVN